jgi:meiotically up-regulated gene 157 (Mug157) protein
MIFSMFRPSDDACTYPLFGPAYLFAVLSLRQLATLANRVLKDAKLAEEAQALATEVETADPAVSSGSDGQDKRRSYAFSEGRVEAGLRDLQLWRRLLPGRSSMGRPADDSYH